MPPSARTLEISEIVPLRDLACYHGDCLPWSHKQLDRRQNRKSGVMGLKFESGNHIEWLETIEKAAQFVCREKQSWAQKSPRSCIREGKC